MEDNMAPWLAILLIAFGIALLFIGKRLWLLGAGIGALLGTSIVFLFPSLLGGWLGVLTILGLAVALGVLAVIFKGFTKIIAWGIGFFAGAAIAMSLLDILSINAAWWNILLGFVGGVIGAVLANRFFDWVIIISAAIIGAMLAVRGLEMLLGAAGLNDALATLLVVVLAGVGIWYNIRTKRKGI
jgi:hypothetical protein